MIFNKFQWKRAFAALAAVCFFCRAGAEESSGSADTLVHHLNAVQAQEFLNSTNAIVLDVRTPREFAVGRIVGAINIDFRSADFEKQLSTLDTNKTYVIHCATGNRSSKALPVLEKLGFKYIYHLDGGMKGWEKAGLPVEK